VEWASFHTFRHTCASLLFDSGRNIRQVCDWLGHADPAFTLRTYVHLIDGGLGEPLELGAELPVAEDAERAASSAKAA
jgi:integrase